MGASPERGWAFAGHAPALQALASRYEIAAVATTRHESAREAARLLGAVHAFTDGAELARDPNVDLVSVVVKVPSHARLVEAAADAGKHVYCEWPLATTTEEAASLLAAAQRAGIHHAVGLQARCSPVLDHARAALDRGYVGEIRSATAYSSHPFGARGVVPAEAAYALDGTSGATLLTVTGGHTLDAVDRLLGPLVEVSAQVSGAGRTYRIDRTDEQVVATAPTDVMLHGTVASGAAVSLHVHNGSVAGSRTRIEITGTEGALVVAAEGGRAGVQLGDLRLQGFRSEWEDLHEASAVPIFGNVAELYERLADDIASGTHSVPDFAHAVRLHRLLDAVRAASDSARRLQLPV